MTEIINSINEFLSIKYKNYLLKNFGLSEIMHKTAKNSDQPMPVTIPDRLQVSLDDTKEIITWIRWQDKTRYETNDDWSFGVKQSKVGVLPLRFIFCHKSDLGEDLVFDFINSFPEFLDVTGFQFVFTSSTPQIDPDHETIYNTELGKTVYEKHRFTWNVYAIDFSFEFIQCETDDIRLTEKG